MYTIIGGDGKEYGPVTAEQVRSWIAGGRANLETKVKAVGADEWKRVADFPEISGSGTEGDAATAYSPAFAADAPKLDIIRCYERSWALLKANFWPLVGVCFLFTAIYVALWYIQKAGLIFISPLFAGVLNGGLYYYFLRRIRGLPTTVGDAFVGFTKGFVTLLVAGLLVTTFICVGFVCLLLPGIYLLVAYSFAYIVAVDKGLGFWESMEKSRRVVTAQWWRVLGLLLLSIPFLLLGIAVLGVGIFVAVPLTLGAFIYAYEDLFNPKR